MISKYTTITIMDYFRRYGRYITLENKYIDHLSTNFLPVSNKAEIQFVEFLNLEREELELFEEIQNMLDFKLKLDTSKIIIDKEHQGYSPAEAYRIVKQYKIENLYFMLNNYILVFNFENRQTIGDIDNYLLDSIHKLDENTILKLKVLNKDNLTQKQMRELIENNKTHLIVKDKSNN